MKAGHYDAIIVGARVSGAATGLLLARAGAKVLIVDRDIEIGDTLSTHALMRPAVELLSDWGLLDQLQDAGTPIVRQAQFKYGSDRITVPVKSTDTVPGLCAPRLWLLDRTILDAAVAAGADLSLGSVVVACLSDAGDRVVGVSVRRKDGTVCPVHADLVIGADGRTSRVAEMVGAKLLTWSPHRAVTINGYFPGIPNQGYRWFFGHRVTGGAAPTNAEQALRFGPRDPLAAMFLTVQAFAHLVLGATDAARTLAHRAIELQPREIWSRLALASALVEAGDIDAARGVIADARRLLPDASFAGIRPISQNVAPVVRDRILAALQQAGLG